MSEIAIVFEQAGRPVTTSRIVAEHSGKQRRHAMRDIRSKWRAGQRLTISCKKKKERSDHHVDWH